MSERVRITIGGAVLHAQLYESNTSRAFFELLPLKVAMGRWGDEYYGDCGLSVQLEHDARADMEVGELAIWPQGSALCIFFGPTPASVDDRPRAVSPVNPIGRIQEDTEFLKSLPPSIDVEVAGV
jgi:hypothetical protein